MPTYAILGATGATGSSLVRFLHAEGPSDVHVNMYARSASRLESMHPFVKGNSRFTTFTGGLDDPDLLRACLTNVDVIFSVVAQNTNEPGCSIAQQTAHCVVAALERLRKDSAGPNSFKCPTVVFLSSASLNPVHVKQSPPVLTWLLHRGIYYVYHDLELALEYYRREAPWVPLIEAQPGGLVKDGPTGFELTQNEVAPLMSYDDLARAMVKMATVEEKERWTGTHVSVKATGKVKQDVLPLIRNVLLGLIAYYLPSLWHVGKGTLW